MFQKMADVTGHDKVSSNIVRQSASVNLLATPETAHLESAAMDHGSKVANKHYDVSKETEIVAAKSFLTRVNATSMLPSDLYDDMPGVLESRREREEAERAEAKEEALAWKKEQRERQSELHAVGKVSKVFLSAVVTFLCSTGQPPSLADPWHRGGHQVQSPPADMSDFHGS